MIVAGPAPDSKFWRGMFSADYEYLETPAYDPTLRIWFSHESDVMPDLERDALICGVCDEPSSGTVGFGNGIDEVRLYREEAGLNPQWHFGWVR